jgi:hypothetical protein
MVFSEEEYATANRSPTSWCEWMEYNRSNVRVDQT